MSKFDDKLKAAIDRSLAERVADSKTYLAVTGDSVFTVERADLLYVWDQYRNQYLDFSAMTHPIGHRHGAVTSSIAEQMAHYHRVGCQGDYLARWPVEYAKMLSESLPRDSEIPQQVMYFPDAATAYETACVLCSVNRNRYPTVADFSVARHLDKDAWEFRSALVLDFIDIDGRPLNPYMAQTVVDEAIQGGAKIIVDESRTGFGRLGTFWGQERYNIDADITVVGTTGGGGFQFGALIAAPEIFEQAHFAPYAYSGDPVICAAGAATMGQINLPVLEHVTDAGHTLHNALTELQTQFPDVITDVRGAGLYQTLECHDEVYAADFRKGCLGQGLLLPRPRGALVTITPPLITSEEEIRRGVDLMAGACLDRET